MIFKSHLTDQYLIVVEDTDQPTQPQLKFKLSVSPTWRWYLEIAIRGLVLLNYLTIHDHVQQTYRICSNTYLGFYFLPGSEDLASKRDRPLFLIGVYKVFASTSNQKFRKMAVITSLLAVSLVFQLAISIAQKHRNSRLHAESYNTRAHSPLRPYDHHDPFAIHYCHASPDVY